MGMTSSDAPQPDTESSAQKTVDPVGLMDTADALWGDLRGIVQDHLQLLALEAQRAGESLAHILAYSLVIGVLLLFWLVECGLAPSAALLLFALFNVMGMASLAFAIRRRSRLLRFPATQRSLQASRSADVLKDNV
jgi:Flp pilus assembly protein TadB